MDTQAAAFLEQQILTSYRNEGGALLITMEKNKLVFEQGALVTKYFEADMDSYFASAGNVSASESFLESLRSSSQALATRLENENKLLNQYINFVSDYGKFLMDRSEDDNLQELKTLETHVLSVKLNISLRNRAISRVRSIQYKVESILQRLRSR